MGLCCSISKKSLDINEKNISRDISKTLDNEIVSNNNSVNDLDIQPDIPIPFSYFENIDLNDKINIKIAFKRNKGIEAMTLDNNKYELQKIDNVNEWIANLFSNSEWKNWIVYNNQMCKDHPSDGHCKGILLWNENRIAIFNHSIPNFPLLFDGKNISKIEGAELVYAQHLCYIDNIDIKHLDSIITNLIVKDPHIIISTKNILLMNKYKDNIHTYKLENITFISKKKDICIYNYISIKYNCQLYVQSWVRGHHTEPNVNITKAIKIKWPIDNIEYKSTSDHSKYFISDKESGLIGFGDLNLMKSQFSRGGGYILIKDNKIYELLKDMIQ